MDGRGPLRARRESKPHGVTQDFWVKEFKRVWGSLRDPPEAVRGPATVTRHWIFIIDFSLQSSSVSMLANSTPLLEKEGYASTEALVANGCCPSLIHKSCSWATLTTDNNPNDA